MTEPTTAAGDALGLRTGLPSEFQWLTASLPRDKWGSHALHPTAAHWLQMHEGFRRAQAQFALLGEGWREGRLEARTFQGAVMPALRQFLSHLDGHHNIESVHYFPALAGLEPRMARGFDLLDRDHHQIEALLQGLADAANAFNRAVAGGGPDAVAAAGDVLTAALDAARPPLSRHLLDEEDIIVPLLTLRGDPLG